MKRIAMLLVALSAPLSATAQTPPWIGLQLAPGTRGGVAIIGVVEGSPGKRAGIASGEEVLAIDGQSVTDPAALVGTVAGSSVGARLSLRLLGSAGERTVDVVLEERPRPAQIQRTVLTGKPAPDFTPKVVGGPRLGKLSSLKGQVVLLDFFATWCGPCREAMPALERMHEKLGKKGLKVVGISTESAAIVSSAASRFGLQYSLVSDADDAISGRYHVYALPTIVLVDRRGLVHHVSIADIDAATAAVEQLLAQGLSKNR